MINRIFLPRGIQVVVASFGGVGTTMLCRFISIFRSTNCPKDIDGLKHSPLPPITHDSSVRFVYVYGNPIDATISLFNRRFHYNQSRKLQRYTADRTPAIPRSMTLSQYAKLGEDRLHFDRHFHNWYETYLTQPTLFLRYETLFENVVPLIDFLELPSTAAEQFPKRRPRRSGSSSVSAETMAGLESVYGGFKTYLDSLHDVQVRQPAEQPQDCYQSVPYRWAIAAQFTPWNLAEIVKRRLIESRKRASLT